MLHPREELTLPTLTRCVHVRLPVTFPVGYTIKYDVCVAQL